MSHKERKQREEVLSNWVKMFLKEHYQRALDMILPDNLNLQIHQTNLPILLWLEMFTKQIYLHFEFIWIKFSGTEGSCLMQLLGPGKSRITQIFS